MLESDTVNAITLTEIEADMLQLRRVEAKSKGRKWHEGHVFNHNEWRGVESVLNMSYDTFTPETVLKQRNFVETVGSWHLLQC